MQIRDFLLERFFADYEFSVPYQLSASDCEPLAVGELLELAGVDASELLALGLGYTESPGDPALRSAIAAFYPGCTASEVVVTNAPQEAIFLSMQALVRPGDRVIVQTPSYQSLGEVARSIGADVVAWPMVERDGRWELGLDTLEPLLRGARLLVVNAPHNPTGHQPTRAERAELFARARHHGVRVFSDEMYRGLEPSDELALEPAACVDGRAVSLWGTSKTFGLAGLRIGWLVSRDRAFLHEVLRRKDYTTICSSAPSERLAQWALGCSAAIIARNRRRIADHVERVNAVVSKHADRLSWIAPRAGPVALARVAGESASSLCERARTEAGLLLVPSRLFDMDDQHVRLGLGRAGFADALDRLDRWLEAQST